MGWFKHQPDLPIYDSHFQAQQVAVVLHMTSMAWRPGSHLRWHKLPASPYRKMRKSRANSEYLGHRYLPLRNNLDLCYSYASGCCRIPLFRGKAAEFLFFSPQCHCVTVNFLFFWPTNWIRLEDFGPLRGSMSPWWHVWWALHARIPKDVGMEGFILIKSTAPSPP